jgi:hypothetical protein
VWPWLEIVFTIPVIDTSDSAVFSVFFPPLCGDDHLQLAKFNGTSQVTKQSPMTIDLGNQHWVIVADTQ